MTSVPYLLYYVKMFNYIEILLLVVLILMAHICRGRWSRLERRCSKKERGDAARPCRALQLQLHVARPRATPRGGHVQLHEAACIRSRGGRVQPPQGGNAAPHRAPSGSAELCCPVTATEPEETVLLLLREIPVGR